MTASLFHLTRKLLGCVTLTKKRTDTSRHTLHLGKTKTTFSAPGTTRSSWRDFMGELQNAGMVPAQDGTAPIEDY